MIFSLMHKQSLAETLVLLEELQKIEIPHDENKWTENEMLKKTLFKSVTAFIRCRQGKDEEALVNSLLPHLFLFLFFGRDHFDSKFAFDSPCRKTLKRP